MATISSGKNGELFEHKDVQEGFVTKTPLEHPYGGVLSNCARYPVCDSIALKQLHEQGVPPMTSLTTESSDDTCYSIRWDKPENGFRPKKGVHPMRLKRLERKTVKKALRAYKDELDKMYSLRTEAKVLSPMPLFQSLDFHIENLLVSVVDFASAVGICIHQIVHSRNRTDITLALSQMYHALTGDSAIIGALSFLSDNIDSLFLVTRFGLFTEAASDSIDAARSFLTSVMSSELVNAVTSTILSMVALKCFSRDVSKEITKYIGPPQHKMTVLDCVTTILSSLSSLTRIGEAIAKGVPITSALFMDDPVQASINEGRDLLQWSDRLYEGLCVPGKMHRTEFMIKTKRQIEVLERTGDVLPPGDGRKHEMKIISRDLKWKYLDLESLVKSRTRNHPIGLILSGDPGIGKSKVLYWMLKKHSKVVGREFDENHVYNKVMSSVYWEKYEPDGHPYIRLPEGGSDSAKVALSGATKSPIPLMVSLCDSLPFPCDMAFKDKGDVFARPEVVAIDTNNPGMHADILCVDPSAFKRRFLYVHMAVREEFTIPGTVSIDIEKSIAAGGNLLDRYNFTAYLEEPVGNRKSQRKVLCTTSSIDDFETFLVAYYTSKIEEQQAVKDIIDSAISCDEKQVIENPSQLPEIPIPIDPTKIVRYTGSTDNDALSSDEKEPEFFFPSELPDCQPELVRQNAAFIEEKYAGLSLEGGSHGVPMAEYVTYAFVLFYQVIVNYASDFACWCCKSLFMSHMTFGWRKGLFFVVACLLHQYGILVPLLVFLGIFVDWRSVVSEKVNELRPIRNFHYARERISAMYGTSKRFNPFDVQNRFALAGGVLASAGVLTYLLRTLKPIMTEGLVHSSPQQFMKDVEDEIEASEDRGVIPSKVTMDWANLRDGTTNYAKHRSSAKGLAKVIDHNIRAVGILQVDGSTYTGFILGIYNNYAIMNKHLWGGQKVVRMKISHNRMTSGLKRAPEILINTTDYVDLGNDIVMFVARPFQFRDISTHIISSDNSVKVSKGYIYGTDVVVRRIESIVSPQDEFTSVSVARPWRYDLDNHSPGVCGLPLIIESGGGSQVVGIHFCGRDKHSECYSAPITREVLLSGKSQLGEMTLMEPMSSCEPCAPVSEPVPKSMFRYEVLPRLEYMGKLEGSVLAKSKSRMQKTKLAPHLPKIMKDCFDEEMKSEFGRPMMAPTIKDGVYKNPFNKAAVKMACELKCLDSKVLKRVVDRLTLRIVRGLKETGYAFTPLSVKAAINGIVSDKTFTRINLSTSSGFGLEGKKRDHLIKVESELNELLVLPSDVLLEMIVDALKQYENDVCAGFVYEGCLKDEPREFKKIIDGKTRVFYVSSLTMMILARMFLGPLYASMVEQGDLFCTAIGINMHTEADRLVSTLSEFSHLIMEGDYSGYDQSMPIDIGYAATAVTMGVLREMGYNEKALKITRGLLTDSLFPRVVILKDLFVAPGLQPSGKYGTAEDNSLRNLIMLMYAWYSNPELESRDFFDHVLPRVYGDDLLAAVKPDVGELFNNHTYQKFVENEYGMGYTPANKGDTLLKFVNVDSMTFLKRSFEYDSHYQRWFAPIAKSTIFKALEWTIPSDCVTREDQITQTCVSMLWEAFLHFRDSSKFENFRSILMNKIYEEYGIPLDHLREILPPFALVEERIVGE